MHEAAEEAGHPLPSPKEERELLGAAAETIGDSVLAVYQYWIDKRITQAPVRRGGSKVGGNDPCPCGSGKKYKSCHGSSDTN
jgi:uncharacterized protein YecA (UPF0149 family)